MHSSRLYGGDCVYKCTARHTHLVLTATEFVLTLDEMALDRENHFPRGCPRLGQQFMGRVAGAALNKGATPEVPGSLVQTVGRGREERETPASVPQSSCPPLTPDRGGTLPSTRVTHPPLVRATT